MILIGSRYERPEDRVRYVQCPLCRRTYTGRAFVCPDPQGRAQQRANDRARSWLETHPCTSPRSEAK